MSLARSALVALITLLTACSVIQGRVGPDRVADGPPQALGLPATGPIIVIGQGVSHGVEWRYSVYESAEGWCTQLETGGGGGSGCGGDLVPAPGSVFGSYGWGSGGNDPVTAEGTVTADAVAVNAIGADGRRFNAVLMGFQRVGFDTQAFVVLAPPGTDLDSLVALDANGEVLAREELNGPLG
ncbi:MAG TPA: hypothetical protein VHL52_08130 [Acidimicrobiia bacterium]|nr:hypothetical protein [Acidimicrobiia bacterium]